MTRLAIFAGLFDLLGCHLLFLVWFAGLLMFLVSGDDTSLGGDVCGGVRWRPALGEAESNAPKGGGNRLVEF